VDAFPSCCTEFRVQNQQHTRQAYREHVWIYQRLGRCLFPELAGVIHPCRSPVHFPPIGKYPKCEPNLFLLDILRWIALQNGKDGQGPLASYFKGEVLHGRDTDIFTSNMCAFSYYFGSPLFTLNIDLAEDVGIEDT